jgi:hypothetical protein
MNAAERDKALAEVERVRDMVSNDCDINSGTSAPVCEVCDELERYLRAEQPDDDEPAIGDWLAEQIPQQFRSVGTFERLTLTWSVNAMGGSSVFAHQGGDWVRLLSNPTRKQVRLLKAALEPNRTT